MEEPDASGQPPGFQDIFSLRRPKDVKAGLSSGAKSLGKGLVGGVVGLFAAPIVGATQDGFAGFAKGVATGAPHAAPPPPPPRRPPRAAPAARPARNRCAACMHGPAALHAPHAAVGRRVARARRRSGRPGRGAPPPCPAPRARRAAGPHPAPPRRASTPTRPYPPPGVAGAVILPVTGLSVGVVQVARGVINQPEAIAAAHQGKVWDKVRRPRRRGGGGRGGGGRARSWGRRPQSRARGRWPPG
jgi:hypothetical protein